MTERPLLLCYDGSPNAGHAITAAGPLLGGATAHVCFAWMGLSRHVLNTYGVGLGSRRVGLPQPVVEAADDMDAQDAEIADRVAAEGAQIAVGAGFEAQPLPVQRVDREWQTILEVAEDRRAPLIVMGARGHSGVKRALLGSVSTAVLHHSHIPTLVVPEAAEPASGEEPLLLCYDGSADAKRAIEQAALLLRPRRALVLHLWESWVARAPALAGVSGTVHGMAAELDELADEQSAELAGEGVAAAEAAGFDAEPLSSRTEGPLWRGVLDAADACGASAIVMGSRGLSGISAMLGSVSCGVAHHSGRPVMIVPPELTSP